MYLATAVISAGVILLLYDGIPFSFPFVITVTSES